MRTFDMTPLYRSTIGFDRLFDELFDNAPKRESGGYPPYNIEVSDDTHYKITLAVAGFTEDDIDIEVVEQSLSITCSRPEDEAETTRTYLHQGIAGRGFERRFQLADHVRVTGATLDHGLLNIDLEREIPEAKKPRKINIDSNKGTSAKVLKGPNAA